MAFVAVPTRRTLGFTTTNTVTSAPQPPKKIDWPDSVREYVQRCFATDNAERSISPEEMQTKLKQVINGHAAQGDLNDIDWTTMPLPQELILAERKAAMTGQPSIPVRIPYLPPSTLAGAAGPMTSTSLKRKIDDNVMDIDTSETTAPWQQTVNPSHNVFEDRISYPTPAEAATHKKDKKQKKNNLFTADAFKSSTDLERRRQRFELDRPAAHDTSRDDTPMSEANDGPVIGTCQNLEKNYFRLTAPPKPETVRPLPILQKTLDLLKKKWRTENNYGYICDQFKSLRQDLTVQHIKNEFTVSVYELHARIALEKMDLGEYNQCQTQLRALYKQKLGGHPAEFLAYRILYFIYTCNRTDMNDVLSDLTPADREEPAVKHALEVRSALASGNYHRYFQLFLDTPNMGGYLMDMFVGRERLAALASICRA